MRVGSLVESIISRAEWHEANPEYYNIQFPDKGVIYTVRNIIPFGGHVGILLEEIINPDTSIFGEPIFHIRRFRELQPPMDVSEVVENAITETESLCAALD